MLPDLPVTGPATRLLVALVGADPDAALYADDPDLWAGYLDTVKQAYADAADHDRSAATLKRLGVFTPYAPPLPWSAGDPELTPAALAAVAASHADQALALPDAAPVALSVLCARHSARLRLYMPRAEARAEALAERYARLRAPVASTDRLPEGWLDRARLVPLREVLEARAVESARGRWKGCPACGADVDATRRGIVAPHKDGWYCNHCKTSGDALAWVAFALTGARRPTAEVGRWYAARWNLS